jgi:hypothetical protein
MTLTDTRAIQKALYVVVIVALFLIIRSALDKERRDAAADLAARIASENNRFDAILKQDREQFRNTLAEMQSQVVLSRKTITLSRDALQQLTAAGSFCYLEPFLLPYPSDGQILWQLMVSNPSHFPLDVYRVAIHDNAPINSAEDADRNERILALRQLGPLPPGCTPGGTVRGMTTDISVPQGSYYIQINTRNDWFYETLNIDPNSRHTTAPIVEIRDQNGKLIAERTRTWTP